MADLKKTFPLDGGILGSNSALALELGGTTDADVIAAVIADQSFPTRPNGVIDLAHVSLIASGANPVAFQGGPVTLGFSFSAGVTAGVGIFDNPKDALASLKLGETPGLDLSIGAAPNSRFALLNSGYQASGSVSGSHPIGAIGSFTFGATGAAAGLSAVLHRFPTSAGADTVLKATVKSWKLPRHLDSVDGLAPGTWVLAEANGSLAVQLGTSLGYNFNFVRQAKLFGLSGDVGLKIDAAATATFGFDVSGRYLVVVGRESDAVTDNTLRLRLFKLSSNGLQFGLNLKIGVTGVETLTPNSVDDFVKAVFGVHGAQIVNILSQIEKWTDPSRSVGQLVAGLVNDKALELLKNVTGIDPQVAFDGARAKLLGAIKLYQSLPSRVSSELLALLNDLDGAGTTLQKILTLLASTDEQIQKEALTDILAAAGFADSPIGRLLTSLADRGLLNLLDRLPDVRAAATTVLSILDGGVIASLQDFINKELDLNKVIGVVQQTDFNKLDSFLVGRLSVFFDKTLGFADLNDIRNAINLVITKRQEIYDKARTALNSRYGFELATAWQRADSSTAVIDSVFDMGDPAAKDLFQLVVKGGDKAFNKLLTTPLAAVRLNAAVLSHELSRKSTLEISLPHFNFQSQTATTAIAHVTAHDDGGRVLLFDATGDNTVSVRNKFSSSVTVAIAAAVAGGGSAASFPDLRIHSTDGNTWSYQLRYAKSKIKREELEAITRPFLTQYMAAQFAGGTSLSTWYGQLETTSESILHNGPEVFGDLCASFEVTIPGDALGAWTRRMSNPSAAAKAVSVAIQKTLKSNLLFFYLSDIRKLANLGSSAPLLAWAAIPAAFSFDGSTFNTGKGNDVFWDHVDRSLRRTAVQNDVTAVNLRSRLNEFRLRLEEAGLHDSVQFYLDDQANVILAAATSDFGDRLLENLLLFESRVVNKASGAVKEMQKFLDDAGTAPSRAVNELANFAADISVAFNKLIGETVFADLASFRAVGQMVFAEASRALSGGLAGQTRAMLTLDILNPAPPRAFPLSDFVNGRLPGSADIALPQRLVSA